MSTDLEQTLNLAGYERLKSELSAKYPRGRFVGIANGAIVADAASLAELISRVRALGLDPKQVLAVQAGIDAPQYAIILSSTECVGHEPSVR